MLPGKLNNRALWPKTPPGPHLCSQQLLHSVRGSVPLTFKLCQGQAETHGKDTELGLKASSAVAALFLACVQVCVHLAPSRSGFLSVWCSVISEPLSVTAHVPPRVCLCGFQSLHVSPCVSPCLVCGFPSSPPAHKPVCLPPIGCVPCSEFPLGVWKCEYHQMSRGLRVSGPLSPWLHLPLACGRCLEDGESVEESQTG